MCTHTTCPSTQLIYESVRCILDEPGDDECTPGSEATRRAVVAAATDKPTNQNPQWCQDDNPKTKCEICGEGWGLNVGRRSHVKCLQRIQELQLSSLNRTQPAAQPSADELEAIASEEAEMEEAELYLLAYLTLCREYYGVKDNCMDDFKTAVTRYAETKDKVTLKKLSRRFGVPATEIATIANLLESPFKHMQTKKQEYKMAEGAFNPVLPCKPRVAGYDEKGRPQTIVEFPFPDQLADLLSDPELFMDANREVSDDGEWCSDVRTGGLWKAHPMVRAGVNPYLVSIWMDGGEITGFMGPRRGTWKFVFAAWKCLNLSEEHQTKQSNMRLAFITHEKTFKQYGARLVISGGQDSEGEYVADTSFGSWMRLGAEGKHYTFDF